MKLLRYGPAGHEKPGILDRDGHSATSGVVKDINGETLSPASLDRLRRLDLVDATAGLRLAAGRRLCR